MINVPTLRSAHAKLTINVPTLRTTEFTRTYHFDARMTRSLVNYMGVMWRSGNRKHEDWTSMLKEMPKSLRREVTLNMYADLLDISPVLKHFKGDEHFVSEIVCQFQPVCAQRGDLVGHYGEPCTQWCIVSSTGARETSFKRP
jgi:hypothetical protein